MIIIRIKVYSTLLQLREPKHIAKIGNVKYTLILIITISWDVLDSLFSN